MIFSSLLFNNLMLEFITKCLMDSVFGETEYNIILSLELIVKPRQIAQSCLHVSIMFLFFFQPQVYVTEFPSMSRS